MCITGCCALWSVASRTCPRERRSATFAATSGLLHAAGGIFLAGVQIAAPGLVATLVADVALGFLGKASPQLPVLFIGLAVKNLLGLAVLIAVVAYWPHGFSQRFAESIALGEQLLHLARLNRRDETRN